MTIISPETAFCIFQQIIKSLNEPKINFEFKLAKNAWDYLLSYLRTVQYQEITLAKLEEAIENQTLTTKGSTRKVFGKLMCKMRSLGYDNQTAFPQNQLEKMFLEGELHSSEEDSHFLHLLPPTHQQALQKLIFTCITGNILNSNRKKLEF